MNSLDVLRNFPLYGERETLFELLNKYELFKETIEKPGDIVVIGKNIASTLITFANFSEVQTVGDRTRLVYGFDSFKEDRQFNDKEKYFKTLQTSIDIYNQDRFIGWKDRIIYKNNDIEGFKNFLEDNIGLKISLLYCVDMEEKKDEILSFVKPHILKKAKIIFNKN